jgi:hypothetical protein
MIPRTVLQDWASLASVVETTVVEQQQMRFSSRIARLTLWILYKPTVRPCTAGSAIFPRPNVLEAVKSLPNLDPIETWDSFKATMWFMKRSGNGLSDQFHTGLIGS